MTTPASPIFAAALASVPNIRRRIERARGPVVIRVYYGVRIPIREFRDNRKDRKT